MRLLAALLIVLGLALIASAEPASEVAPPEPAPVVLSLCGSDWAHVAASLDGWRVIQQGIGRAGGEKYVVGFLVDPEQTRLVLLVAEYGLEGDPRPGPLVYCAVLDEARNVVESVGVNPLTEPEKSRL